MSKLRKALLSITIIAIIAVYFLPWKNWAETWAKSALAARGMAQLEFHIDSIGFSKITIKDIALGELKLPDLAVGYSPLELVSGNFRDLHTSNISFRKDNLEITLKNVEASLAPDDKNEKFVGDWKIAEILVAGAPISVPPLAGKGKLELEAGTLLASGDIASSDAKTSVSFALSYPTDDADAAILTIKQAKMPWSEGEISVSKIALPLYAKTPIALNLVVKSVSLNSLLAAATSNKASGTGLVSGTIPIIISRDGTFTLKKGELRAENAGTIKLAPEVIPSDAAQVSLLREVLQDFHYSQFSMGVESDDNKQLLMSLSLDGNNPAVYNGRVVKLNIRLSGDVIELVKQSMEIIGK